MITLPITKVATKAIPPDFGTGLECEERGLGMSITRTKRVMTYVRATEQRNIVPAKARWVRNLRRSSTSAALGRAVLRHEARKLPPDGVVVQGIRRIQPGQCFAHPRRIGRGERPHDANLRMTGRARMLVGGEQFFEELLPLAQAGKFYFDICFGKAREPDHVSRKIDDLHRLAHVEHEELAAFSHEGSLQHELRGLRNRHEIPRDVRMRDRQRSTAGDLLADFRNDAAGLT